MGTSNRLSVASQLATLSIQGAVHELDKSYFGQFLFPSILQCNLTSMPASKSVLDDIMLIDTHHSLHSVKDSACSGNSWSSKDSSEAACALRRDLWAHYLPSSTASQLCRPSGYVGTNPDGQWLLQGFCYDRQGRWIYPFFTYQPNEGRGSIQVYATIRISETI